MDYCNVKYKKKKEKKSNFQKEIKSGPLKSGLLVYRKEILI